MKKKRNESKQIVLDNAEEIIRLYLSGWGHRKIDSKFGIKCTKYFLIRNNIEIKKPIPRFTKEEINEKIKEQQIELIGSYINISTSTLFKCLKEGCGYEWMSKPKRIISGRKCLKCLDLLPWTNDLVDQTLKENNRALIRVEAIATSRVSTRWLCLMCNYEFKNSIDNIINKKQNCPSCTKVLTLTNEIVDGRLLNFPIKRIGEYPGNLQSKTMFQCKICEYEFEARVASALLGVSSCPKCNASKGERLVLTGLFNNNIKFHQHYGIKNIFSGIDRVAYVDFYLPGLNYIIEYNGLQHYEPSTWGSMSLEDAEKQLLKQQQRDKFVDDLCVANNINIIWIDGRKFNYKQLEQYVNLEMIPNIISKNIVTV